MQKFEKFVDLSSATPLFVGGERLVYEDPRCDDWLIKVCRVNNGRENKIKNRVFKRYSKWRYGAMKSWYKEQEEYLALLARIRKVPDFIAGFYGFCQTSEGPGMVVEKIRDAQGNVANTVSSADLGSDAIEVLERLVNDFFDRLIEAKVVAKDLHMANVAIAGNYDRLVLIDGLGDGVLLKTKKFLTHFRNKDFEKKRKRFIDFIRAKQASQAH